MKTLHRILGLAFALPLLIMALSGLLLVFRGEIGDLSNAAPASPINVRALGARIEALEADGFKISSVWASGARADLFYAYGADAAGRDRVFALNGAGAYLGDDAADATLWIDSVATIHSKLFLGAFGENVALVSGIVLIVLIILGAAISWPKLASARRVLAPPLRKGPPHAFAFRWHRALGLWLGAAALFVAATGVMLANSTLIAHTLGVETVRPTRMIEENTDAPIGPGDALAAALERYPGARITMIGMPKPDAPWYRVRLLADGEARKVYGMTTLFYAKNGGAMIASHDARSAPAAAAFVDSLYALHAGHFLGLPSRAISAIVGVWLTVMITLGLVYYIARRGWRRISSGL